MRLLFGTIALALVSGGALLASQGPAQAAQSTFQRSCNNIVMSGATPRAHCRRRDGSWVTSSLAIGGIENIDGNLQYTGKTPSNFQETCSEIGVSEDLMTALCRRRDQSINETQLHIENIDNIDGQLTHK